MTRASRPVVIITGVSGGIGLAAARQFLGAGWIVVGSVRSRGKAGALRGMQIDVQIAEMVKTRDLERLVQGVWRTYGRIDGLVCNAGYGLIGPIDSLDYTLMQEQLAVNTLAPAYLAKLVTPYMKRQGGGVIVGVSSLVGRTGLSGYSLYAGSKFGMEGIFESLAMELAPQGIRVKLIEPSSVGTAFWHDMQRGAGRNWSAAELGPGAERAFSGTGSGVLTAEAVGKAILKASLDGSATLRYPLGQTRLLGLIKRCLPETFMRRMLARFVMGN